MHHGHAPQSSNGEGLRELFARATRDASAAMARWTRGQITLSLEEVCEVPLEKASDEAQLGDELLTMVVLSLHGEVGGEVILTFDDANARQLASALLGRPPVCGSQWSALEQSALTETGNILGCAYMNALSDLVGQNLVPSAPYFIQDYGASVLQQALMAQALTSDTVLICRTAFHRQGENLNWRVLFLPTLALRRSMEEALQSSLCSR